MGSPHRPVSARDGAACAVGTRGAQPALTSSFSLSLSLPPAPSCSWQGVGEPVSLGLAGCRVPGWGEPGRHLWGNTPRAIGVAPNAQGRLGVPRQLLLAQC